MSFLRPKNWFTGTGSLGKPKNPHSLEHLKFLYGMLLRNQTVTEQNRGVLVEALRLIAEILIWGDQNDATVFDFFLEKQMLSFFLKIMRQRCGSFVCVQLLQTLNILFENIRNETSIYYLLSNNHVNSIIVHKFDFSDEEVMAYYISFLKTLSLKLNKHTIHFFFNEATNDFPLYTEGIKFFNHSESMVRIAVRTLTLNVYKVGDKPMLRFIRNKTAAPYFSNLVWFIGNHILELDSCVRNDTDHRSRDRLSDLVAEHLDHLHYLNDILELKIAQLNEVLVDHLLNRLFLPLYVYSLLKRRRCSRMEDSRPHVSSVVALFLLSQVFLIISHRPLVRSLATLILQGNLDLFVPSSPTPLRPSPTPSPMAANSVTNHCPPSFSAPSQPLEVSLEEERTRHSSDGEPLPVLATEATEDSPVSAASETQVVQELSITDEEKELRLHNLSIEPPLDEEGFSLSERPFLEAVFLALECSENDYSALFALCLLFAIGNNRGMKQSILESALFSTTRRKYNELLMERLLGIMQLACQPGTNSRVRLATLQLTLILLKQLVGAPRKSEGGESSEASPSEEQPIDGGRDTPTFILDRHLAAVEGIKEDATLLCRSFYKSEEIFLDMFEDEWRALHGKAFNVEFLMMESSLLLPPTGTPMTGIDFDKRLPCGEVERACRAIRIFFLLRELSLFLRGEEERELPLTSPENITRVGEVLDLNNSDLIACTILNRDQHRIRRFLVIDEQQIILVEPDTKRLGWGVAKFVGLLQDTEVTGDKEDSRCLHITVHKSSSSPGAARKPILSARFVFDDHIRCMAAKQRLGRGRMVARQRKVARIASLLELPASVTPTALSPRPRADARILSRAPGHPHHDPTSPSSAARFMTRPSSAASMPGGATSAAGFGPPQLKAPGFAAAMTSRHGNTISVVTSATRATRPSSCAIPSQLPPTPSVEAIPLGKIQAIPPSSSGILDETSFTTAGGTVHRIRYSESFDVFDTSSPTPSATATPPECLPSQLPSREESRTTIQRDDASSTDESEENSQHRDRKGKIQVI